MPVGKESNRIAPCTPLRKGRATGPTKPDLRQIPNFGSALDRPPVICLMATPPQSLASPAGLDEPLEAGWIEAESPVADFDGRRTERALRQAIDLIDGDPAESA